MNVEAKTAGMLWLARDDARDAISLANSRRRNAAYHCGQAAEKLVKALLIWRGIDFPALTHRIEMLLDLLPDEDDWKKHLEELGWLDAYSTSYRYPSDEGRIKKPPAPERVIAEAKEVLALINTLCEELGIVLTDDLDKPYSSAGRKPER